MQTASLLVIAPGVRSPPRMAMASTYLQPTAPFVAFIDQYTHYFHLNNCARTK